MAYDKSVPPAPVTPTMLPLATELDVRDVGVIVQPYKTDGKKTKRTTLGDLAGFINSLAGENWKTFTIGANNRIALGDYQRNVIIVPSAKDQSVTLDHFPSNGIIIYAPDWDSASESTFVTIGDSNGARPIIKGGVGIFYCFGSSSLPIVARSLISSGDDSLAQLKELNVDNLIVESELTLPALSILSEYIANGAVTANKIANGAVTIDKIGNGAVTPEKISTGAVTADKISTGAVTADKIGNGAVTTGKISTYAVETDKIKDGAITREKIFNGEVTTDKLANYAVETDKIKDKAVTSGKLADLLTFVKTPIFPRKFYFTIVVTESAEFDVNPNYAGSKFSTNNTHTIIQRMHFSDADNRFQIGNTYRLYNETPNEITVKDWSIDDVFTKIPAWTFKDFYYKGDGWELA